MFKKQDIQEAYTIAKTKHRIGEHLFSSTYTVYNIKFGGKVVYQTFEKEFAFKAKKLLTDAHSNGILDGTKYNGSLEELKELRPFMLKPLKDTQDKTILYSLRFQDKELEGFHIKNTTSLQNLLPLLNYTYKTMFIESMIREPNFITPTM